MKTKEEIQKEKIFMWVCTKCHSLLKKWNDLETCGATGEDIRCRIHPEEDTIEGWIAYSPALHRLKLQEWALELVGENEPDSKDYGIVQSASIDGRARLRGTIKERIEDLTK